MHGKSRELAVKSQVAKTGIQGNRETILLCRVAFHRFHPFPHLLPRCFPHLIPSFSRASPQVSTSAQHSSKPQHVTSQGSDGWKRKQLFTASQGSLQYVKLNRLSLKEEQEEEGEREG